MSLDPGSEDITDIFPHVLAVAAAYGDPTGKYARFMQKNYPGYTGTTYWFYDQPGAFKEAPSSGGGKSGKRKMKRDNDALSFLGNDKNAEVKPTATMDVLDASLGAVAPLPTPTIPWECPSAFATATEVQLDDGVYVTCDELKPFYGYVENDFGVGQN